MTSVDTKRPSRLLTAVMLQANAHARNAEKSATVPSSTLKESQLRPNLAVEPRLLLTQNPAVKVVPVSAIHHALVLVSVNALAAPKDRLLEFDSFSLRIYFSAYA